MIRGYRKHTGNVGSKGYGMIRLAKRLQNLEKGDIILDTAFQPYAKGVTKYSLLVWEQIKKYVDPIGFKEAEMDYNTKDHYTFTLTHKDGYKFVFKGCAAGYHGEGSRGTKKILEDCGFKNIDVVFNEEYETFTFMRSVRKTA